MPKEIIGRKFGELLVLDKRTELNASGNPRAFLKVKCSCGKVYEIDRGNVTKAKHPMCRGCRGTGGKAEDGHKHPLYRTWCGMLNRCYRDTTQHYSRYGGRGITVCDRWRGERSHNELLGSVDGFKNFCADMGDKPTTRHSLDRIDNDGPYEPGNCRWATPEEQYENSTSTPAVMVSMGRHSRSVWAWCKLLGLSDQNVRNAIKQGRSPRDAILREMDRDPHIQTA